MSLFASFASTLSAAAQDGTVESVLEVWEAECLAHLAEIQGDLDVDPASQARLCQQYQLEANTWNLVQRLVEEKLHPPTPSTSSQSPYLPPSQLITSHVDATPPLSLLTLLLSWLSSTPSPSSPPPLPISIRRGYTPYTSLTLSHARRALQPLPPNLIASLDPDAQFRAADSAATGQPKGLEKEDEHYWGQVRMSIFYYLRQGRMDLALDLARQTDLSFLAASIAGGALYSDASLSASSALLQSTEDGMTDEEREAEGNLRRGLWKQTCKALAEETTTPGLGGQYERALFGFLAGEVKSVLPVCESWEDHLWARVNHLVEQEVDQTLRAAKGKGKEGKSGFWLDVEEDLEGAKEGMGGDRRDLAKELEATFSALHRPEGKKGSRVANEAKNPLRVAQSFLAMDKRKDLIEGFVTRLEGMGEEEEHDQDQETLAQLVRFFAHLILAFRLLGMADDLPQQACEKLLVAYVNVLQTETEDENLIASYCAHLQPEGAVEAYSRFLTSYGPETTPAQRAQALLTASTHHLPSSLIAQRVVQLVSSSSQEDCSSPTRRLELIRTLEWLVADEGTYASALRHANALSRYFLSAGLPSSARDVLHSLPRDLPRHYSSLSAPPQTGSVREEAEGEDEDGHVREHLDYVAFFEAEEARSRIVEVWARRPLDSASKLDHLNYRAGLSALLDSFYAQALVVLKSDWLKLDLSPPSLLDGEGERVNELRRIRKAAVPELVRSVHVTLMETCGVVPSNINKALELATVVADERYRLYVEFVGDEEEGGGNKMGEYLELVREAAVRRL